MTAVRFKVCCISSTEEMRLAAAHGAAAVGLVGRMPSGPGVIDDDLIGRIAREVPAGVESFLLTSETTAEGVAAHHRKAGTTTVQLVDYLPRAEYPRLRALLPSVRLVQVVHVEEEASVALAEELAAGVDALLLDSGRTKLAIKELGGTGRVHDWSLSRRIVAASPKPVFLAGGLNPGNAAEAIAAVRPYGLDVCSGLRTGGRLDEAKLAAFAAAVRRA